MAARATKPFIFETTCHGLPLDEVYLRLETNIISMKLFISETSRVIIAQWNFITIPTQE
jgi:hypothetical protein